MTAERHIFQAHNFRGLAFSKKFAETIFARRPRIPLASIQYSKILRRLIFEVRCQSAKNAKIMRLENLALCGITCIRITYHYARSYTLAYYIVRHFLPGKISTKFATLSR